MGPPEGQSMTLPAVGVLVQPRHSVPRPSTAVLLSWLGEEDLNPRYQGQNLASYP